MKDKSNYYTFITAFIGIDVSLLIIGLDLNYEYHTVFLIISVFTMAFTGIMIGIYLSLNFFIRHIRKYRIKHPLRIGILSGTVRPNDVHGCQFYGGPPSDNIFNEHDWFSLLEGNSAYTVRIISVTQIDDSFAIILNPFGEIYPEEDIATRTSFDRIKEYIENGGIFVNTSGTAFYYMWDSSTGRQGTTGLPLETYQIVDSILEPVEIPGHTSVRHSWMEQNFQITTTIGLSQYIRVYQSAADIQRIGDLTNIGGSIFIEEYRSSIYGPKLIPLLRSRLPINNFGAECYPVSATKFGLGYLILFGLTPNTRGWKEKVTTSIEMICSRIHLSGSIE
jgi:hypothetical protein